MANLLEAYAKPIAIAENYYKSKHNGEAMDSTRKLVLAATLRNVNKYIKESYNINSATQKANIGGQLDSFEKFTMNLVNASVPNLIAFDLCIVAPMKDWTGGVTYTLYM